MLGDRVVANPDLERKRDASDSSDALSDQISSLDINAVGRIAAIKRYSNGDLVRRSCWGIPGYCSETDCNVAKLTGTLELTRLEGPLEVMNLKFVETSNWGIREM